MKLTIRSSSRNNEVANKHKKTIIDRLYKGAANKENIDTIIQSQDQIKTQESTTMPNSKESYKYCDPEQVSVSEFMEPHQKKSSLNESESMLLSGSGYESELLKSKRSESDTIFAKIENFSHHYSIKHREVKKEKKERIERSLIKQLYELNSKKEHHEDLQKSNSMMKTAFFTGISEEKNSNEEMCERGEKGYYVKNANQYSNKNYQENYHHEMLKELQPKIEIERHSIARRIKTEIELMQREEPERKSGIYLHKQLKLVHKVQTERSLSYQDRQPGLIKRQNSQKDLLNWNNNRNSYHSLNHSKYENSEEKLRIIRQQLHQIYSGTQMNNSGSSNIENKSLFYNSKKEKISVHLNPRCKENMQDYYRSYLMQARNQENNIKTFGLHKA